MRMSEGVEWAAHVVLLLHWLQEDDPAPVSVARLAESYDLPAPYLGKQVQALSRAGITESVAGKHGGIRLARPADQITLMDLVAAIEGTTEAFVCTEIRQQGMNADRPARDFRRPCSIAHAMRQAELAWRRELAATTVADLSADVAHSIRQDARRHFQRA
ncbi:Rrf2 family transcriptional regulator [Nocardioides sp. TF02-7]|uniref:RrF2 family transcriptional regulator n=1 Tax=Nocardioides sp. TF02-7 TaxID=2917724 RepID=UPI001F06C6DB|nr:Rrf2 family transcriptional regulator [Nocardioides sp. TF02-7]UMG94776.1 Rrf2 family transcriptional regulator [Nocardioides sp. TF02-7]